MPSRRRLCSMPARMLPGRKSWGRQGRAGRRVAEEASALGGQEVLVAPGPDVPADQLLAAPVIDRGVDQVDPRIENCVEQATGVLVVNRWSSGLSP